MALTLMVKLEDLTDLSSVDRWQAVMLKDLPTPETSFPESYKWNDNDPKKGLALNAAGKNSAVALILKEAQDRRKAIKRKAKEGGGDARKSAKVQLGGPSVEAVAYSAELDGGSDDAQVEEGGGGCLGAQLPRAEAVLREGSQAKRWKERDMARRLHGAVGQRTPRGLEGSDEARGRHAWPGVPDVDADDREGTRLPVQASRNWIRRHPRLGVADRRR